MLPPDARVTVATTTTTGYLESVETDAPEMNRTMLTLAEDAVRRLFLHSQLDAGNAGTAKWNPLGDFISPASRVLIKPNWVSHRNHGGGGLECLVTNTAIVEAVIHYVLLAHPREITVADAPVQGCNFDALRQMLGLDDMIRRLRSRGHAIRLLDLRMTVFDSRAHRRAGTARSIQDYVEIDLGSKSALEAVSPGAFRVTMYDPADMAHKHHAGTHRYLIAKEALDADVVVNVPKLKTHRKVGLTAALKNVVGINGKKEYLPHHRAGDPTRRGDCYPRPSLANRLAEALLDRSNMSRNALTARACEAAARVAAHVPVLAEREGRLEGSWQGNDTAWRMVLDLVRILMMADRAGQLMPGPQRRVLTITDAIVAGQGEGPLAPAPAPMRMVTLGLNPAVCDWVHAMIAGWIPERVPLLREALGDGPYSVFHGHESEIGVSVDGTAYTLDSLPRPTVPLAPPAFWRPINCNRARR